MAAKMAVTGPHAYTREQLAEMLLVSKYERLAEKLYPVSDGWYLGDIGYLRHLGILWPLISR